MSTLQSLLFIAAVWTFCLIFAVVASQFVFTWELLPSAIVAAAIIVASRPGEKK